MKRSEQGRCFCRVALFMKLFKFSSRVVVPGVEESGGENGFLR